MTKRTTVAFHVELMPHSGPCLLCSGRTSPWLPGVERFAVRGHRGETPVAVCGYHLPILMIRWDAMQAELGDVG